jgi:hypothetical protein
MTDKINRLPCSLSLSISFSSILLSLSTLSIFKGFTFLHSAFQYADERSSNLMSAHTFRFLLCVTEINKELPADTKVAPSLVYDTDGSDGGSIL